jgi:cation:H+ antiporter
VGNAVGSNIFNLLGALGLGALLAPSGIPVTPGALTLDLPVMIAVAVACLPIFIHGHAILRWEGAFFLLYYAAYTGFLVLSALRSPVLRTYDAVMLLFVLPLGAVTLAVISVRAWRAHRREAKVARAEKAAVRAAPPPPAE